MKMKKYLACLTAALMMGAAFTACGGSSESTPAAENSSSEVVQEAPETSPVAANGDADASPAEADAPAEDSAADDSSDGGDASSEGAQEVTQSQDVEFEPAMTAQPGQAYLAIVDGQWWIQYWGSAEKDGYMLSYNAGIADIQGDGSYTVSVTADTNGFRYDTTGDAADQYTPEGLSFLSVMIPEGESMYPGAVITIDSIKVDGNEIEMSAKNYTSSDDGSETRTNIYNTWVSTPSDDARCIDGPLYDADKNALDICKDYSAQLIDPSAFSQWTTVEVNFTITGTDGSLAPADAGDDADADADADTDAE
ncbi:MAG: hypothetical protein IJ642_08765 [Oscillospiraceae bacterium]|nr:hypothetical protein [Oscillospiraceae bacterium]